MRGWAIFLGALLALATVPALAAEPEAQEEDQTQWHAIAAIDVQAAFPAGWQVVTPETVASHMTYFEETTAEAAAENMRTMGVHAVAFSPEGDAMLRVIAQAGDETMALYYDIERYTPAMRTEIKNDFLDKAAWALTGFRCSEATWTNKEGQGRLLNMKYTIRYGEETVARGRQAYTIRNGMSFALDMQTKGERKITAEEEKLYAVFVASTVLPISLEADMPLFSVGLTLTDTVPEETNKAEITLRGTTTKGATVSVWLMPEEGDIIPCGQTTAGNSGAFRHDIVLPGQGEWRVCVSAELQGYESCEEGRWVSYNEKRLPVTFTSYPQGEVYDTHITIEGQTLSGVEIQCMEGEVNKKATTGSNGKFSFTLDRGATGQRYVTISFTKKNFENRRFDVVFDRKWQREDYVKYLSSRVQSLSYASLSANAEKHVGKLVKFDGEVLDLSSVETLVYIQLGVKQDKTGRWTERLIAVGDGVEVILLPGDRVSLYAEVTAETYAFSEVNLDGDQINIDLPALRLLTYDRKQ